MLWTIYFISDTLVKRAIVELADTFGKISRLVIITKEIF